jgi:hypothetical protein
VGIPKTSSLLAYKVQKGEILAVEILVVKNATRLEYEAAAKISRLSAAPKIIWAGNCRR